ncbi:MAG: ABC transporter permease [Spirochaetaceae bacterium]|nr:MAG: ABC transporter permease [Spirochaetaceae bacterium]
MYTFPSANGTGEAGKAPGGRRWLGAVTILLVLLLWWIVAAIQVVPELFVPHPRSVWQAFVDVQTEGYRGGTLLMHLGASMARLGQGYVLAVLTAVPLGLMMGMSRTVRALVNPLLEFYRPLPPLAYYTLLIVWLGIGDESKVALLYLAAFPPLVINAMAAVESLSPQRVETALSLGARRRDVVFRVMLPSCLPQIFTGMRIAVGFTYTTLVSSEIVAAANGIGWMVLDAGRFLRTDVIFVAIIVMGLTGVALDSLIRFAEARLVPWKGH